MPRHRYECSNGHITDHSTRSVHEQRPVMVECVQCDQEAAWIPSKPFEMLLPRDKMRKHSQPDEWDPETNPKLKPQRILTPGDQSSDG